MPAYRLLYSVLQASLAPGLPDDLEAVLGKLNTYCQCMHGAAGAVAGCGPQASPTLVPCHAFSHVLSELDAGQSGRASAPRGRNVCEKGFEGLGTLC